MNEQQQLWDSFSRFVQNMPQFNPEWELDRLRINHTVGQFDLPNETLPNVHAVILGLVHQRVMFSADREGIPCKSPNAEIGIPGPSFPWEQSNFNPNDYPEKFKGYRELPCSQCRFTQFDSDLKGVGKAPACSEQFTMPLFYFSVGPTSGWKLAVYSVQKTGIPPTKKLMSIFQKQRMPCYTQFVNLKLNRVSKNNNFYALPDYDLYGSVDAKLYPTLSTFFRGIRAVLTAPPVIEPSGKIVHSEVKYRHSDPFAGLV